MHLQCAALLTFTESAAEVKRTLAHAAFRSLVALAYRSCTPVLSSYETLLQHNYTIRLRSGKIYARSFILPSIEHSLCIYPLHTGGAVPPRFCCQNRHHRIDTVFQ